MIFSSVSTPIGAITYWFESDPSTRIQRHAFTSLGNQCFNFEINSNSKYVDCQISLGRESQRGETRQRGIRAGKTSKKLKRPPPRRISAFVRASDLA